jgi:UDP-glucose 4-epimerase
VKVVITGGAGFIGANLCRTLRRQPEIADIVVVDDFSSGKRSNLTDPGVTVIEGSILDPLALDRALASATSVVHLAARPSVPRSISDPVATHDANASGTVAVLEAARRNGVGHVIVASSSSVYGANRALPKHEGLTPEPLSPYAASKLASEAYALAYQYCFGLGVLAFRFFNVFGPLQGAGHAYAAAIPTFVSAALAGEPLPVHGDGRQTRDFTYIDSLTAVLTDAVLRQVTHVGPVNLAFGGRNDLLSVISLLEDILGHAVKREHADPRAGDVRDSQADQTLLRRLFPDITPIDLETGLRATVAWFVGGGS